MPKVSVVIPNYNGKKYLAVCLRSLPLGESSYEFLVVDNGSTDGSLLLLKEQFPQVRLIEMGYNSGFSAAVNAGIKAADSPYVILLNNDTMVKEGFVEQLYRHIDSKKNLFSVQAMMVSMKKPDEIDSAGDYYCSLGWAYALGKGRDRAGYATPRKIFSSCAGAAIYRKSVFEKMGYFDEQHFAYLEDIDVGMRAGLYGYSNEYEPLAVCLHAGSSTSGSRYNPFKTRLAAQNSIYIIYKNMPFLMILLNLPHLAIGFLIKLLFFVMKGHGVDYIRGLEKGFRISASAEGRRHKIPFTVARLGRYVRLQIDLWWNLLRFIAQILRKS